MTLHTASAAHRAGAPAPTRTAFLNALFSGLTGYVELRALPSKGRTFVVPGVWRSVDRFAKEHVN